MRAGHEDPLRPAGAGGTGGAGSPALRIAAGLAAAALVVLAIRGLVSPGGLERHESWWLIPLALALALAGCAARTAWQEAGLMAAAFLAGLGAQLALTSPFWFQHIRVLPTPFSYLITAMIGLQGLMAAGALLRAGRLARAPRLIGGFGWWRVFAVLAVLVLAAKGVMDFIDPPNLPRFLKQLALSLVFLAVNLASFLALLAALPGPRVAAWAARAGRLISLPPVLTGGAAEGAPAGPGRLDRAFPFAVAAVAFAIATLIAIAALEAVPHLDDIVYLFHARYFAHGMLTLPLPPLPEAFDHYLMDSHQGRWFSVNLPGWPAALALGELIGLPWLVSPVMGGLGIVLMHRFVAAMTDRGTANLAILLMASSPWYLSISATGLLHAFTLVLILGAWLLLMRARARRSLWAALAAGALMGWLFLARPLEGLYMGGLTGLWTLSFLRDRRQWTSVALYGLGAAAIAALILPYNAYLTGDAFVTPINAYLDRIWAPGANALGFGPDRGAGWENVDVWPGHSPLEALINAQENLHALNGELFGWGGFSLLFALVFALWGRWSRFAAAMAAIIAVTLIVYAFYWYVGGFFAGPRYWFQMLVPLVILSALGITTAAERLEALMPGTRAGPRLAAGVAFLGLAALAVHESWLGVNKYPEIRGYHAEYRDLARDPRLAGSLILIATDSDTEYGSAFWLNDFTPGARSPLFARDLGPEKNRRLAAAFPDRPVYLVKGRGTGQPHVEIVRGPLSAADLQ
ncbi:MAG: hypothetical protein D6754_08150 [Alphaproteobacteria bacterium]|nr:MAG: hypothetical protein D6754_08150 [Alphaproteobacteria bacterium]